MMLQVQLRWMRTLSEPNLGCYRVKVIEFLPVNKLFFFPMCDGIHIPSKIEAFPRLICLANKQKYSAENYIWKRGMPQLNH